MRNKRGSFITGILLIVLISGFSSCHFLFKDDEEPQNFYLVKYEMVKAYLPVLIEAIFDEMESQYPSMGEIRDRVKHGIVIYKIDYKTTFNDEPVIASGLVAIPTGEGTFPIISYQNGTNTLHRNAPSVNPNFELYMILESMASTGFVIALPDYLGFGSSNRMFHPYLHKESTVESVIDMLRAIEELAVVRKFSLSKDLYLSGYSQGGWATMQLQKAIETDHSNAFNLKASAPAAGPYDLDYINAYIIAQESYPMPYFSAYIFNSFMNLDILQTPIDSVFRSPYANRIGLLFDGTKTGQDINKLLTTSIADLFTANYRLNYRTDPEFHSIIEALQANSIETWNTRTPTRIIHGSADSLVPFEVALNIFNEFTEKGAEDVELIVLEGMDHAEGIVPAGMYAINWFLELTK